MFVPSLQQRLVYASLAVWIGVKQRGKMQDKIWPIEPGRRRPCYDYPLSINGKISQLAKRRHSGKMHDGAKSNLFLSVEKLQ